MEVKVRVVALAALVTLLLGAFVLATFAPGASAPPGSGIGAGVFGSKGNTKAGTWGVGTSDTADIGGDVGEGVRAAHTVSPSTAKSPVIMVSIPSYRDPELGHTLRSLFLHADHPEALQVCVLQQAAPGEEDGLKAYLRLAKEGRDGRTFASQVHVKTIPHTEATGPTKARTMIEKEVAASLDFDYVLMVDSHTLFLKGWDTCLLDAHADTDDPDRTVLSTYAPHYYRHHRDQILKRKDLCVPRRSYWMYFKEFLPEANGSFPRFDSRPCSADPEEAFSSLGWAAGFSFAPAILHEEVPYVDFSWLFFGEEYLMHARLYTWGYEVVTPPKTPILTNFDRSYRPTFVQDAAKHTPDWRSRRAEATERVRGYLEGRPSKGLFGTERTIEDFVEAMGVDTTHRRVDPVKAAGVVDDDPFARSGEIAVKHGSKAAYQTLVDRFA